MKNENLKLNIRKALRYLYAELTLLHPDWRGVIYFGENGAIRCRVEANGLGGNEEPFTLFGNNFKKCIGSDSIVNPHLSDWGKFNELVDYYISHYTVYLEDYQNEKPHQ